MYADLAEVLVKTPFHESARLHVDWLAGRTQHFMNNLGNKRIMLDVGCWILDFWLQLLLAARFTLAVRAERAATGAFALQQSAARGHHSQRRWFRFCCPLNHVALDF